MNVVVCVTTWVVPRDNAVSAVKNKNGTVTMLMGSTKKGCNKYGTIKRTQVSFLLEPDSQKCMGAS